MKKSEESSKDFAARKLPSQERAQMTVDSIMDATKKILEKEGYAHLTTNHIADVAGVSIGTLYQYFSNKETIIYALIESVVSKAADELRDKLMELMTEPIQVMIPTMTRLLLSIYKENEFVLFRIRYQVPRLKDTYAKLTTENFTFVTNLAYLKQHQIELTVKDLNTALFIVENTITSNCIRYLEKQPSDISEDEFIDELSSMVLKYLTE
ncbi:TetR/AcrR family transcriptional regulator [Zhongshania aquimaris]|uniref:TetR/AcrR family transcriptional regulator n=1 Tax=Zhongshania aquimaris TaxID=2857107 RepID=A0ABS6VTJ8_9GAMM|nr:TetR family transcriptional regulator [Zhongshania aquimaris]MBW2941363.1 TetR/AcrR family transcriptional regulator [Zhongshania aquimaris]